MRGDRKQQKLNFSPFFVVFFATGVGLEDQTECEKLQFICEKDCFQCRLFEFEALQENTDIVFYVTGA